MLEGGWRGRRKLRLSPFSRWAGGTAILVSVSPFGSFKKQRKVSSVSWKKAPSCYLRLKVKDILSRLSNG